MICFKRRTGQKLAIERGGVVLCVLSVEGGQAARFCVDASRDWGVKRSELYGGPLALTRRSPRNGWLVFTRADGEGFALRVPDGAGGVARCVVKVECVDEVSVGLELAETVDAWRLEIEPGLDVTRRAA